MEPYTEEYIIAPSDDASKYVMSVKLSTELYERLSEGELNNASISLGGEENVSFFSFVCVCFALF
jgi:hypothetical protein